MQKPELHSPFVRMLFFLSGIVATLAYRVIVIVNNYSHLWSQILWYIGTIGFIIYFAHRFQISETRAELIKKQHLDEKISTLPELSAEEKDSMAYIFSTLTSSKEKWNYIFIFAVSAVALVLGLYLDLIARV